jgi:hypothetical protein
LNQLNPLLPLPIAVDNAAMQTEPSIPAMPKRKRRGYQFSLRTLLIVVVPYVAIYALVLSSILSDHEKPKPVGTAGNFLYDVRVAAWESAKQWELKLQRIWRLSSPLHGSRCPF